MKKYLIIFFILFALQAHAATYTVSQDGSGKDYSIAAFNSESGDFSDDTFYFSGDITTPIIVNVFGTSGHPVILDGYQADDTTYQSLSEVTGRAKITVTDSQTGIDLDGVDYVTVVDFEITGFSQAIRIGLDTESNDITLQRNYLYEGHNGIYIGTTSYNVTVGGSSGNGNVVKNVGVTTAHEDIAFDSAPHDVIISYNHLYADSDSWGIDGIVNVGTTSDVLIEYNSIHGHNHTTAQGENAIDLKKQATDWIIRYNDLYDSDYEPIIIFNGNTSPGESADNIYIYGNRIHDSIDDAINFQNNSGETYENVYIFSNLIYNFAERAMFVTITDANIFNNTISEVGTSADDQYDVAMHYDFGTVTFKNNIVIKSSTSSYSYRALNLQSSGTGENLTTDYNIYYWPSQSINIDWEDSGVLTLAGIQGGSANGLPQETNSTEGDPGLVDWDNGDFTPVAGDACINAGADLGSGAIATLTIQGVEYPVYWDSALGASTDWSSTIPSVEVLRRDSDGGEGWDAGAYEYKPSGNIIGITIQ